MPPYWDSHNKKWAHYRYCRACHNCFNRYKINSIEYEWLKFVQGDTCAIPGCDNAATCYDHDHETGKFRGFLCYGHNTGLGKLGDNLAGLMAAVIYLHNAHNINIEDEATD